VVSVAAFIADTHDYSHHNGGEQNDTDGEENGTDP
jgi:hypothetical protein